MALQFQQILSPGIAQLSYLIGDDANGAAAVVDPRPDCDIYVETARKLGLEITHIFETHIHADFMSGARELAQRLGTAGVYCSEEGSPEYAFSHEAVHDGDTFAFGKVLLTARHTPGHTPEHISFLLAEKDHKQDPWGVLSGDSLFVNSSGRPDLLGEEQTDQLVEQLHQTLYGFYLSLSDDVILYPCHGQGSDCGPDIGDRLSSTIGYERRHNKYLQREDVKDFRKLMESEAPPVPTHYPLLKKVNARGPEVCGNYPTVPGLRPEEFQKQVEKSDSTLVDTRSMLAFGGAHIEGAVNLGAEPELSVYAGWLLEPEQPILLVLEDPGALEQVVAYFWRTGFTRFSGYLLGGMTQWNNKGLPVKETPQISVHEIKEDSSGLQLLDVRAPEEWEGGHIPGARHHFVGKMKKEMPRLEQGTPVATYCATGYRASLAASLLEREGYEVRSIPGSWQAWTSAGYPVEKDA